MNIEKLKQLIDEFNDGNWDEFSQFFNNDMQLFINIVTKYGLLESINPLSDEIGEYQNLVLWTLVKQDPDKWIDKICEDVINSDLIKQDDGWYLYLDTLSELSEFFDDRGRDSTKRLVSTVLGEEGWEPYWDTTDDVYRDVVEELNPKNLNELRMTLFKELEGKSVSSETSHLEEYDENNSGEVTITKDNFNELVEDDETFKYLLKKESDYIWNELYSLHSNCYNSSYQDELYDDIWSELSRFFEGRGQWETKKSKYNPEKTQYYVLVKIRDINADISKYLFEFSNSQYNQDTLEYLGSYTNMIKNGMGDGVWDYLDFRVPEYPDSSKVDSCINELFGDYF